MFGLLREMNARQHSTFSFVTHDERLAARCERVVLLVLGRDSSDITKQAR